MTVHSEIAAALHRYPSAGHVAALLDLPLYAVVEVQRQLGYDHVHHRQRVQAPSLEVRPSQLRRLESRRIARMVPDDRSEEVGA